MKLYEITNEYENIFSQVNEQGEITEHTLLLLDEIKQDFNEKAIDIAAYIKNIEAEAAAINNAVSEMKDRENKLLRKAESLKGYLQINLQQLNIHEIKESPYFKIKLRECPVSVNVYDETAIPKEYFKTKEVITLDKIKVKEALNEGQEIDGVMLHRNIKLEIK